MYRRTGLKLLTQRNKRRECGGVLYYNMMKLTALPLVWLQFKQDVMDHYVVVYKIGKKVVVADPAFGIEKVPLSVFQEKCE